ncbi:MAG: hypothetical protein WBQ31_04855 [Candidatus Acidiferrales bacterium]
MSRRLRIGWLFPLTAAAALISFAGAGASAGAGSGGEQTPQKIISDYIHAEGGARALARIQSLTIEGTLHVTSVDDSSRQSDSAPDFSADSSSGSYSLITKAPNKLYSEIVVEPQHIVAAYNGKSAWGQDGSGAPHTFTGREAVEWESTARYLNDRLLNAKKDKTAARLVGIDSVNGHRAYHLVFTFAPGVTRDVFFDSQTHLILREIVNAPTQSGGTTAAGSTAGAAHATASVQPIEQFDYEDYQPVDGIPEPRKIELRRGGRYYQIAVTHVEINGAVKDTIFDFPRADSRPLPDIAQLLRDMQKNQKAVEEIVKQYTCRLSNEEEKLGSNGDVSSHSVKDYDIFYVGDEEIRHLLAKDGKPLEGDEKKKEDQRFGKEFDAAKKKQAELANDPKKQQKEEERDEAQISDFLSAENFTNPRREIFRGQEVIVFDFGPNPAYKPKNMVENLVQKLVGVIWVDEQARDVVRLEARFSDNFKIGGGLVASLSKGSNFVFEQTLVNNEVWLPSYDEVHAAARLVFVKVKANQIDRYSDYKKFSSEIKLGTSAPVDQKPQ